MSTRVYDQEIKKDDTFPSFTAQIVKTDGTPIDADTAVVWIKKPDSQVFTAGGGTAVKLDAEGNWAYPWDAADTDTSGEIELEFRFVKDSKLGTSPGDRFYLIRVRDH